MIPVIAPRSQEQKHFYEQYVRNMHIDTSNAALVRWSGYPGFVRRKLSIDYEYAKLNGAVAERNLYEYAANRLHGILQEKVLMLIMEMDIAFSKLSDETLDFMEARVKTPVYRKRIGEMKETYATGSEMIDFAFRDKDDKTVRLSDFRGKVVLLDMWFTGCSGCVAVANTLPAVEEAFRSNDSVVFVSLSIDRHRDLWLQSIDPDKKIVAGNALIRIIQRPLLFISIREAPVPTVLLFANMCLAALTRIFCWWGKTGKYLLRIRPILPLREGRKN